MYALAIRVCIPRHAAEVYLAKQAETLQICHERLGQHNKRHVMKLLKQHVINVEANKESCDGCALGIGHQQGFGTQTSRPNMVAEQINADVCGPMTERSVCVARYYVCFEYVYTKFSRVSFINTKSEVADCLRKFLIEVKIAGHVTKVLLSDGSKEFDCKDAQKLLEEHGFTHPLTMPYNPAQNGAAEQEIRPIVESVCSLLHASGLPKKLWPEACNTVGYILNRTGPTQVEGKTPLELWTGSYATLCHLRALDRMLCADYQIEKTQVVPKE